MKGSRKLLSVLNSLLADELTVVNQYLVHSEMCENWGYNRLHMALRKQSTEKMYHALWLIERIIFLGGSPNVRKLNPLKIGKTVTEMISYDHDDELETVHNYRGAIKLAHIADDQGSADLLIRILKMEEGHIDWTETQLEQIGYMELVNYLINQTESLVS